VQRNVAKLASAPSQPQREQHPPTIDEVRSLMTASARLNPMFGLYIRVMVATGARRAEVCALRWSDVDFTAGTLNVSRSYTVLPGIRADRPTKTRSERTVVLDPATTTELATAWSAVERLMTGVPVPTVAARLGHADGTTTMKIYAHRTRHADQHAADVVGRMLNDRQDAGLD
jgi:integrase